MNSVAEKLQLFYCSKKGSNTGRCSKLATHSALLVSKKNGKENLTWRCDEHKLTGTQGKKIDAVSIIPIDQTEEHQRVDIFLSCLINKSFYSRFHRRNLIGKYLKPNGSIMCQDEKQKWCLAYYHQII